MSSTKHSQPRIAVSLRQISPSTGITGVVLKVANIGSGPVTILAWDSPLDPLALQLGLLSLTPVGSDGPLDIPAVKISRQVPPEEDSLITIDPGSSQENKIIFKEPIVPLDILKGSQVDVECKGRWRSIWSAKRSELSAETINALGIGDETAFKGDFQSNHVEILV